MEYPLNIYITAHTLISSLGFGISENKKAIHDYRSGIRMQEAGRISDSPILAGMIDSVELEKRAKEQLEKRAKELDISSYTRLEQLFILTIQEKSSLRLCSCSNTSELYSVVAKRATPISNYFGKGKKQSAERRSA